MKNLLGSKRVLVKNVFLDNNFSYLKQEILASL